MRAASSNTFRLRSSTFRASSKSCRSAIRMAPLHVANNGLSAVVDVDVFDSYFLLAFAAMPIQRLKQCRVSSRKLRCRMHGGPSPGAPKGNRNAFKHGRYTAEAIGNRGASLQCRRQRLFTIGSGSIILNDRVWRTIHECKVISPAKRNGASRCRFRYNCSCARLAQRWWFRLRISSPLSVELWHQRKLGETWPIPPRQCGGRSIWKIHLYAGCSGE